MDEATQLLKASQGSSDSLTDDKAAAKSHENKHKGNPSPPSPLTSKTPQTDLHPVPAKEINEEKERKPCAGILAEPPGIMSWEKNFATVTLQLYKYAPYTLRIGSLNNASSMA